MNPAAPAGPATAARPAPPPAAQQRQARSSSAADHQRAPRAAVGPQPERKRQQQEGQRLRRGQGADLARPGAKASTATIGTAARLSCSADCAARLLATRTCSARGKDDVHRCSHGPSWPMIRGARRFRSCVRRRAGLPCRVLVYGAPAIASAHQPLFNAAALDFQASVGPPSVSMRYLLSFQGAPRPRRPAELPSPAGASVAQANGPFLLADWLPALIAWLGKGQGPSDPDLWVTATDSCGRRRRLDRRRTDDLRPGRRRPGRPQALRKPARRRRRSPSSPARCGFHEQRAGVADSGLRGSAPIRASPARGAVGGWGASRRQRGAGRSCRASMSPRTGGGIRQPSMPQLGGPSRTARCRRLVPEPSNRTPGARKNGDGSERSACKAYAVGEVDPTLPVAPLAPTAPTMGLASAPWSTASARPRWLAVPTAANEPPTAATRAPTGLRAGSPFFLPPAYGQALRRIAPMR